MQSKWYLGSHPVEQTAGVDEVGRGPLAGEVTAAAVILDPLNPIEGLNDSKKLSEKKRESLSLEIKEKALAYCIATASIDEIDDINILHASMLAMKRAVEGLSLQPQNVLVDGNRLPHWSYMAESVIKGDSKVQAIAAASILAKVDRDHEMLRLHGMYPQYGFDRHKGYPTKLHMQMLEQHGPSPIHRKSFAPVARLLR